MASAHGAEHTSSTTFLALIHSAKRGAAPYQLTLKITSNLTYIKRSIESKGT